MSSMVQFPVAGFFAIAQVFLLPGMFESWLMAVTLEKDTYCISPEAINGVVIIKNAQVFSDLEYSDS